MDVGGAEASKQELLKWDWGLSRDLGASRRVRQAGPRARVWKLPKY